ncbi:MAG: acylphosphatase [Chloroflexi bacterium]|nr:acylphosphatase [Chloroflexota bacterium]
MARIRAHLLISGLVQGVYFRDTLRQLASQKHVSGWVRNLADGRVEAILEGEQSDVDRLVEWSKQGPPDALVDYVEIRLSDPSGEFGSFHIIR